MLLDFARRLGNAVARSMRIGDWTLESSAGTIARTRLRSVVLASATFLSVVMRLDLAPGVLGSSAKRCWVGLAPGVFKIMPGVLGSSVKRR